MDGLWIVLAGVYGSILSWMDWRTRILPNRLTVGGLAVVLLFRFGYGGMPLFMDGFAAAAVAGAFLLIPFLARGAGGGDVKMMAAAGAIVGWSNVIYLLWYSSLAGLVLAIVMMVMGRLDAARMKHLVRCVCDWRYDRKVAAAALPPRAGDKERIPFSIAITIGMLAAMVLK